MTRATRADIDLSALRHNLQVASAAAPHARQMAIVKANAYGHGMLEVAQALEAADAFGVASLEEAIQLREVGIRQRIVLLEGFSCEEDLRRIRRYALETVVHQEHQVRMLEASLGDPISVWIKIDTGMHRLGFAPEHATDSYRRLQHCPGVSSPLQLMTHLANADDPDDPLTDTQVRIFAEAVSFDDPGEARDIPVSIANSAGILGWPATHADWVRPGIMLYGASPFLNRLAADAGLKPVMTLRSELIAVNHHRKGARVGYGGHWTCPENMPVGVVAIGYGDGYPRHAVSGTPVLVNAQRVPLIGRVSMDMLTVDLRSQLDARLGDPVVLWGSGLPVETVANSAGTIAYELLCGVTRRVPFVYQQ